MEDIQSQGALPGIGLSAFVCGPTDDVIAPAQPIPYRAATSLRPRVWDVFGYAGRRRQPGLGPPC